FRLTVLGSSPVSATAVPAPTPTTTSPTKPNTMLRRTSNTPRGSSPLRTKSRQHNVTSDRLPNTAAVISSMRCDVYPKYPIPVGSDCRAELVDPGCRRLSYRASGVGQQIRAVGALAERMRGQERRVRFEKNIGKWGGRRGGSQRRSICERHHSRETKHPAALYACASHRRISGECVEHNPVRRALVLQYPQNVGMSISVMNHQR